MQKHDLNDRNNSTEYDFGRPVREIFGALRKLTGKSFDEVQLFQVFADGSAHQEQLQKGLFERTARTWANWWEQHWSDYLQDAEYSRVKLPELEAAATSVSRSIQNQHFTTSGGNSNCLLESYNNRKARDVLIDLDTGRTAGLPEKWRQTEKIESHLDEIEAWANHEGFDLMGTEYVSPRDQKLHYALFVRSACKPGSLASRVGR